MVEQLHDDELDQVNGGHRSIEISIKNSFNTGGTEVGNVKVEAYKADVSISIGSSGGLVFV